MITEPEPVVIPEPEPVPEPIVEEPICEWRCREVDCSDADDELLTCVATQCYDTCDGDDTCEVELMTDRHGKRQVTCDEFDAWLDYKAKKRAEIPEPEPEPVVVE